MKTRAEISVSIAEKLRGITQELVTKGVEADELREKFDLEQENDVNNLSRHFFRELV